MMSAPSRSRVHSLPQLLDGLVEVDRLPAVHPTGLALDSRRVTPGDIFFAMAGTRSSGMHYVRDALAHGAVAVVLSSPPDDLLRNAARERNVPLIEDPQLSQHLGEIASRFYGHPSRDLSVIGVTGTDGKTSVTHFIAQAVARSDARPAQRGALIGTLGNGLYGALQPATHTTPDAISLQAIFDRLRDQGASHVAMEVSSHGLQQERVGGVAFNLAVLTNLGRDHLDYHGDVAAYKAAKRRLFAMPGLEGAVLNAQEAFGRELLSDFASRYPVALYGLAAEGRVMHPLAADWVAGEQPCWLDDGFRMDVVTPDGRMPVQCRLLGQFNALNVLATIAVLRRLGFDADAIAKRIAGLHSVPGRMQLMTRPGRAKVVIDYAHTPQALAVALDSVRRHTGGRLWCVFGCGGDRDRGKRPQMGRIAEQHADRTILTDDNPRHEDPKQIVADIQSGWQKPPVARVVHDRAHAIGVALDAAGPDDIVLIAGKGHETAQQIGDDARPFNDAQVVRRWWGEDQ